MVRSPGLFLLRQNEGPNALSTVFRVFGLNLINVSLAVSGPLTLQLEGADLSSLVCHLTEHHGFQGFKGPSFC
jgi:hypothetical protein